MPSVSTIDWRPSSQALKSIGAPARVREATFEGRKAAYTADSQPSLAEPDQVHLAPHRIHTSVEGLDVVVDVVVPPVEGGALPVHREDPAPPGRPRRPPRGSAPARSRKCPTRAPRRGGRRAGATGRSSSPWGPESTPAACPGAGPRPPCGGVNHRPPGPASSSLRPTGSCSPRRSPSGTSFAFPRAPGPPRKPASCGSCSQMGPLDPALVRPAAPAPSTAGTRHGSWRRSFPLLLIGSTPFSLTRYERSRLSRGQRSGRPAVYRDLWAQNSGH